MLSFCRSMRAGIPTWGFRATVEQRRFQKFDAALAAGR